MHDHWLITTARRASYLVIAFALIALVAFTTLAGDKTMSELAQTDTYFLPAISALLSILALAVVLVGAWFWQRERFGTLGNVAFVVALLGTLLSAGAQWSYVFVVPYFADAAPKLVNTGQGVLLAGFIISYAVLALGWILFGLATMRAGLVPRWLGVLMVAGAAIAFLPLPSRTLVLGLAVALLGHRMGRTRAVESREPALA